MAFAVRTTWQGWQGGQPWAPREWYPPSSYRYQYRYKPISELVALFLKFASPSVWQQRSLLTFLRRLNDKAINLKIGAQFPNLVNFLEKFISDCSDIRLYIRLFTSSRRKFSTQISSANLTNQYFPLFFTTIFVLNFFHLITTLTSLVNCWKSTTTILESFSLKDISSFLLSASASSTPPRTALATSSTSPATT